MRKNKTTVKSLYKNSIKYIKESKNYILAIVIIFFISAIIGLIIPIPEEIAFKIIEALKELLKQIKGKNTFQIIKFILFNNTKTSLFGLITGIFLGIIPILLTITNGYLLGFVSLISIQNGGILSLWKILPHGIFELPAIFISLGMGLRIGATIFQENIKENLTKNIKESLKTFILIIIPLLITAAIIEGFLISLV